MKGIILAGGSGTRLYPLTQVVCKQLLPVYDKPMICYPLTTLMLMGMKDILIISTPTDTPLIKAFLGDGSKFGINLSYRVQDEPRGIPEAFTLGEKFIGDDSVCLILGDNIFYFGQQLNTIKEKITQLDDALIFVYHVRDPERFGVVEFNKNTDEVISIEEKPQNPKSNYASVGLYCYPNNVIEKVKNSVKPSKRGELEITELNNLYFEEKKLKAIKIKRGAAWLDAGTPKSLMEAANYMEAIESRQGLKLNCLEEVAYRTGFINRQQFIELVEALPSSSNYKRYLESVLYDS